MNQLDFWIHGQPLLNDIDLTKRSLKKPELSIDTSDDIVRQFYGQHFLIGWLKVKHSTNLFKVIRD